MVVRAGAEWGVEEEEEKEVVLRYNGVFYDEVRGKRVMYVSLWDGERYYRWYPRWMQLVRVIMEAAATERANDGAWRRFWDVVLGAVVAAGEDFLEW